MLTALAQIDGPKLVVLVVIVWGWLFHLNNIHAFHGCLVNRGRLDWTVVQVRYVSQRNQVLRALDWRQSHFDLLTVLVQPGWLGQAMLQGREGCLVFACLACAAEGHLILLNLLSIQPLRSERDALAGLALQGTFQQKNVPPARSLHFV